MPGVTPFEYVPAPAALMPSYGLLSVAQVLTGGEAGDRWEGYGVEFQSDNDAVTGKAGAFILGCSASYSVTLTKTATANQYTVNLAPPAGPYEVQVDAGAWAAIANGGTILVTTATSTVNIREKAGLKRVVTVAAVSNAAATGTVKTAQSDIVPDPGITGAGRPISNGTPFGVFGAIQCKSLGLTGQLAADIASRRLALGEPRTVEAVYEDGSQGNTPRLADPATVLPAGAAAVNLRKGLGALEDYLRKQYGGTGALHVSPALAPYMAARQQLRSDSGGVIRTWLGTPVAFGGGYRGLNPADASAPAVDKFWLYATGQVTVRRSAVFVPAIGAEALDRVHNDITVVAERHYLVTHDSLAPAAVLVDLALET